MKVLDHEQQRLALALPQPQALVRLQAMLALAGGIEGGPVRVVAEVNIDVVRRGGGGRVAMLHWYVNGFRSGSEAVAAEMLARFNAVRVRSGPAEQSGVLLSTRISSVLARL